MYVMNSSDRWIINYWNGAEELGLYAVGAQFVGILALIVSAFRMAWWPIAMDTMQSAGGTELFRIVGRMYIGLGSAVVVLLTALSPYLIELLVAPGFYSAYPIVGILSWSSIFYGFYLICAGGIWKKEKTAWTPLLMGISALLNIGLNVLLVPKYGAIGAASATSVSFFIWNILTMFVSEKLWSVKFDYVILLIQVLLGFLTTFHILSSYHKNQFASPVWGVTIVAIALLIILSIPGKYINTFRKRFNPTFKIN